MLYMLLTHLRAVYGDNKGVTALEYGLIAGLIAVVIIGAVSTLGNNLSSLFNGIAGHFSATGVTSS